MPSEKQSEQEKIELVKQEELSDLLEDIGNVIEEEQYIEARDKLEDVIRDAKRYNLNIILKIAQTYYNFCKNPTKGKFKRKEIQSELELPKISRRAKSEKTSKRIPLRKEFKVNKYITLKQEGVMSITDIHVEGHTLVRWHSSISITERNEENTEEEFNNRCLSIQKWVESEYDKTFLPYDIAFKLLERLSDLGEPIAKKVFKRDVLKGFLSGETNVVNFILRYNYLNLFSEEDLDKLFDKRNLNILSGGIIHPSNLKRLIKFDEDFAKLVLKKDINYYLKSDNFEIFDAILRENLFNDFSEEEFQDFDLRKLDEALFNFLKEELNYCIKWHYHLKTKFESFQKICEFLIFRNSQSILNFFQRKYSILTKDQKVVLISYLLLDHREINQSVFAKIQNHLKDLDWRKIAFILLENLQVKYRKFPYSYRKLNENTIDLLENYDIPFLSIISEEIKKKLNKKILDYGMLQREIRLNFLGILLQNNPRILREFLSKHYDDLNSEEKCWVMTTFIIYKESSEFLMKSLKKKYEQLDLIEFSQTVISGNYVPSKQNIEKLGELGLKILLNVIIYNKYEYNYEYLDKIGKLTTNIVKDNIENLKILIIECLLASFQANSYEAIVNLFNTEIVKLLNKSDVIKISRNSGDKFLKIIDKIFDEEYPPTYLEYFLSKLGPEGGDLIFKFTQRREYLDYIFEIMREMGSDMIAPSIKNVILNENYYEYGDWGYEFVKEFFNIYDKDQICQIFESPEHDLINRLFKAYHPEDQWANIHNNIIIFLFMAYKNLDLDIIQKINTRLTEPMKEEIFLCFQDDHYFEDSSKIKKYNDITKILGRRDKSIMDLLSIINDISNIILFEDLKVILKDKEFTPPKNFIEKLNEIRILLEERIDLFSPEDFGCEAKNYINDFFYEFEKFFQYIIFGYYSSEVKHMLKQLTHFFDCLLVLNNIIHNIVKTSFHYEHMNELRNDNYEYYKRRGLFLKAPAWVEKNKILSNKLNMKPRTYPAIRMRWWKEDWEKHMTDRDKNLKNEFAYYFAQRRFADNIMKSISLEVIDEKLKVKMDWKLPDSERNDLINLNNKLCSFKINEENIKIGLSLHNKYYRECALEILRNIKPSNSKNTVSDLERDNTLLNHEEIEKSLENQKKKELKNIAFKRAEISHNQVRALQDIEGQITRIRGGFELSRKINKQSVLSAYFTLKNNNVYEIAVFGGGMKSLPESVGRLKSLEYLNLRSNEIESLPKSIGKLGSLKKLNLSGNNLRILPKTIGNLRSLEKLNLHFNYLKELPNAIGKLEKLKKLKLGNNHWKLSVIPTTIGNLKFLEYLDLRWNKLVRLPSSLTKLVSLKYLNLNNCFLEKIPERIGDLKSLKQLDLSRNQLESLPDSLFDLNSLEIFNLEGNALNQIPELIGRLINLKELDISLNKLVSLPPSILQLKSLQKLNIELNPIVDYQDWDILEELKSRGVKILQSDDSYYDSIEFTSDPDSVCPSCGSGNFETDGISYWTCPDCGLHITKG